MSLVQITDHPARAVARLVMEFKDSAEMAGVNTALANQVQEVEDALYGLLIFRSVAAATGNMLDRIGAMTGTPPRGSLSDVEYRRRVNAQILSDASEGTHADLYAIISAMHPVVSDPSDLWEIRSEYVPNHAVTDQGTLGDGESVTEGEIWSNDGRRWRALNTDITGTVADNPLVANVDPLGHVVSGAVTWYLVPVEIPYFIGSVEIRMKTDGIGAVQSSPQECFADAEEARECLRYLKDAAAGGVRILLHYRLNSIDVDTMFRVFSASPAELSNGVNFDKLYAVIDSP